MLYVLPKDGLITENEMAGGM